MGGYVKIGGIVTAFLNESLTWIIMKKGALKESSYC